MEASIRAARTQGVYLGCSTALSALLAVGIAVLAGWFALRGYLTVGELITVIGLAQYLMEPFGTMAEVPSWIAEARASAERVGRIEDAPFVLSPGAATLAPGPHDIALTAVRYGSLDGMTMTIGAGEMVGVATTRGADADAVVKVLSGQLARDQYTGEIQVGGVPLDELELAEARRAVLVEPHKVDLFTGSLRSNLVVGASDPRGLDEALRASSAVDVIDTHHDGLEHRVTERGSSLSGGQRQRLTLARALLQEAPVLVLHEPTTAVDAVTESAVAQGIAELRHGPAAQGFTTVIVTCSPALLAATDRVLLVDAGRVMVSGTHQQLMTRPDYRAAVLR